MRATEKLITSNRNMYEERMRIWDAFYNSLTSQEKEFVNDYLRRICEVMRNRHYERGRVGMAQFGEGSAKELIVAVLQWELKNNNEILFGDSKEKPPKGIMFS